MKFYNRNAENIEIMCPNGKRPLFLSYSIGKHIILVPLRSNVHNNIPNSVKEVFNAP